MNESLLSRDEVKKKVKKIYKEEKTKLLYKKWNNLSIVEKKFVIETLIEFNPQLEVNINESKWYNTLGDIIGIFDPTGVVDIINGISYWKQDDKLFAILSWVSALPILGDIIAKPVIGVMKTGTEATKMFRAATVSGDALKIAKSAEAVGGPISKFVISSPTWGEKLVMGLRASVGRVPGLGKGLVNTVEEYVKIFSTASKEMKGSSEVLGKLTSKEFSTLTKAEKDVLTKELTKQTEFRGFRDYKMTDPKFMDVIRGGMPRLWGNRSTRSLMRKTKWYLGLLDWLGLGNFVGPEELELAVPNLDNKILQYNQTTTAQDLAKQDLGALTPPNMTTPSFIQQPQTTTGNSDLKNFFTSVLGKAILT